MGLLGRGMVLNSSNVTEHSSCMLSQAAGCACSLCLVDKSNVAEQTFIKKVAKPGAIQSSSEHSADPGFLRKSALTWKVFTLHRLPRVKA